MAATNAIAVIMMTVVKWVDGDSLYVDFPPDCTYDVICKKQEVRLMNFDTPELFSPKCPEEKALAQKAKAMAEATFPPGSVMVLSGVLKKDLYKRVLGESKALENRLLEAGLAVPYSGKHKRDKDWCSP
jgi:endonuclease YncB( thermonuclease family)